MPKNIQPEIRKDYIQEKYVIIAPVRNKRPHDIEKSHRKKTISKKDCFFCPEKVDKVKDLYTIYKNNKKKEWLVKVIPNIFPSVSHDYPKAYGVQDVVIETPKHELELDDLSIPHIAKILEAYAKRTRDISQDVKIEYILIFKNSGGKAGASIEHAHSQIFATQFLPPHLIDKSQRQQEYKLKNGTCIFCDVINKERNGPRWVCEDAHIVGFTPYASMHHYEVWLMPKRHIDNITQLTAEERLSFATAIKHIIKKIDKLGLPYNYYFHQVINDDDQHLYLKIKPRGNIWAGVEIGSGLIINPVTPEAAATYYRQGQKCS